MWRAAAPAVAAGALLGALALWAPAAGVRTVAEPEGPSAPPLAEAPPAAPLPSAASVPPAPPDGVRGIRLADVPPHLREWATHRGIPLQPPFEEVVTERGRAYRADGLLFGPCDAVAAVRDAHPGWAPDYRCGSFPEISVTGVLPDGTRFEIDGLPDAAFPDPVPAGVVMIEVDGTARALGSVTYRRAPAPAPGAVAWAPPGTLVARVGWWAVEIDVYPDVLAHLSAADLEALPGAVAPALVDGHLVLDLSPPLRWQHAWEVPGTVAVSYGHFTVYRRCPFASYQVCDATNPISVESHVRWLDVTALAVREIPAPPPPPTVEPVDVGPLAGRVGHSVVWTGEEMIVWGGRSHHRAFADGAAFDPRTGTWRMLAAAPLEPRGLHVAAWTGREMLVVGGEGHRDGAAYDPATDRWRPIATAPVALPPGDLYDRTPAELALGRLFIWSTLRDELAVYDPDADVWSVIDGPGLPVAGGVLRWDGWALWALGDTGGAGPMAGARLWEGQGEWEAMPAPQEGDPGYGGEARSAGFAGWALVAGDGALDTRSWRWRPAPANPMPGCEGVGEAIQLDDRPLLFGWCGHMSVLDPERGTWAVYEVEGFPTRGETVWTGTEVLNWGDACCFGGGSGTMTNRAWRWAPP